MGVEEFIVNNLDYIFTIFLTAVFTYLITLIVNSITRPYPMNALDHFMRKHLQGSKIKGQNLHILKELIVEKIDPEDDIFDSILITSNGWVVNIDQDLVSKFGAVTSQVARKNHEITANLEFGKAIGSLKVERLPALLSDDPEDVYQQRITVSLSIKEWKLPDVKDILHDATLFLGEFGRAISSKLKVQIQESSNTLSFKFNKKPAVIDYLSKVNINYISSNLDGMSFSLSNESCTFSGVNTTPQFEDVINAMVWYV